LKAYFRQYRPFFIFLFKFFGVYAVLIVIYKWYLSRFDSLLVFAVDDFTQMVADQVKQLLLFLGYKCTVVLHNSQASVKLYLEDRYVARVVEGCNALSVIILFVAFVVAFSGKWRQTTLFILCGSILIHTLNVVRIALLSIALLHYPEYENLLHGIIFPLFIYGVVFGLWVIWVNKFSSYAATSR
jgi:exosortase family protein XrtF